MAINLNEMAVRVANKEGGKVNLNIAEVKEVQRLVLEDLATHDRDEVDELLDRICMKGEGE